jgi:HEAT repeat protein
LLDDPVPAVRTYAADQLTALARRAGLRAAVLQAANRMLQGEQSWRGLEQAALVAGALDDESAADRLLELLDHDRPEVMLAAGWALRRLAVPRTLPPLLDYVQRQMQRKLTGSATPALRKRMIYRDQQLAQIHQAFGLMDYQPADPVLRQFIAKGYHTGSNSRAAAVWALGMLHAGEPDDRLVRAFVGRLSDVNPMKPEAGDVRRMAAVSLGRMKADRGKGALQRFTDDAANDAVRVACLWALSELTGEPFALEARPQRALGWFLQPAEGP